jgi:hypothetical protein
MWFGAAWWAAGSGRWLLTAHFANIQPLSVPDIFDATMGVVW